MVDHQYVKVTIVNDVECPRGSSRHLLSESDDYVELRGEATINLVDFDIASIRIYKPTKHLIVRSYGCCKSCWGLNTKKWKEVPKDENFTTLVSEGFDWDIVSGELSVKEHSIKTSRSRECKEAVEPVRSWTDKFFPKKF
jgi:hypothetical protein